VQFIGQQILEPKKSPFVLLDNQRRAFALVRARVEAAATSKSRPAKTIILVEGPPGSGKSVVAAQVWAALVTHPKLPPRQRGHYDHIGKPEFKLEIPF
jgi:pantothenate kinase-related protein Tda10